MTTLPDIPAGAFCLLNTRIPARLLADPKLRAPEHDGLVAANILIDGGKVRELMPAAAGAPPGIARVDLDGGMVWPTCADLHTHLDNTHTWSRAPNPTGLWSDALAVVERDREANWSTADIVTRMDYALRCAWTHGTSAIRTHLDSLEEQRTMSWAAFRQIRERWRDRVTLQGVALVLPFRYQGSNGVELADLVAAHEGLLGGVIIDHADPHDAIERIFTLARERDLDVDLHVDETDNPASNGLQTIAEAALRHGYEGRVTVGHCCSLARREPQEAARTIERVAEAGVTVVSLPMCNLYLQDRRRGASTPQWRGITLVHELDAAGVPVAFASDDTRDAFYAFGDLDPVEVFVQSLRISQLEQRAAHWISAVTSTPAGIMGIAGGGMLGAGCAADLILFRARDWWELGARPTGPRIVLRRGIVVTDPLPDFRELEFVAR